MFTDSTNKTKQYLAVEKMISTSVYCDLSSDDVGWLVIMRRSNFNVSFDRNWQEYKDGFGELGEKISLMIYIYNTKWVECFVFLWATQFKNIKTINKVESLEKIYVFIIFNYTVCFVYTQRIVTTFFDQNIIFNSYPRTCS